MAPNWSAPLRLKQAALARAQPLSALLELTYRCNWRCVFCYNPRHHDLRGMSAAEWRPILDDLRALGTLSVALTGGEPLTHPEFLAIATAVRDRAFALRILSNGALVTAPLAAAIAALRPLGYETSLHGGCAATHDRATATAGSFDALWRGIDRLRDAGVPVLVKTPLTRLNEDEIDAMRALVEARGLPWQLDAMLTPRDDGDAAPLAYRASPRGVETMMRALLAAGQLPAEERAEGGVNCGLGRITVAIDPEGNVFPCVQWRRRPLGNARETPLRELWHGSPERQEAADVARRASTAVRERRDALSSFAFCPALAQQQTGDPLRPTEAQLEHAEIAARVRQTLP